MRYWRAPVIAAICAGLCGCACARPQAVRLSDAQQRWKISGDYYALLELVDTHIDPQWNGKVSKAGVIKWLGGEGAHSNDEYPNAGPNYWVYSSTRPIPNGSYLFVQFGDDGFVKDVGWLSE